MQSGKFITFEGIDGAGKSTQIAALVRFLRERGLEVIQTREPGGTPVGEKLREILLHEPMQVMTETMLFFTIRAEHLDRVIRPALERGAWVISDRFTDATYAYQAGGRGFPPEIVEGLEAIVQRGLQPFRTVLFDLSPRVAAERLAKAREADRCEAEDERYFTRVRRAYLDRAGRDRDRFLILNAELAPDEITRRLLEEARTWL